jgi:methionyl-tRNA formyltransferase
MRAVFLGSPPEAVPSLEALMEVAEVALVITQPDRPRGRSKAPVPPEVKVAALDHDLEVAQPTNRDELQSTLEGAASDVALLTAYGRLIRPDALAVPTHGFVNVHFSLLPRWRGASPVVRAILAGDRTTGVTLMQMDEGLDTGPTIAVRGIVIGEHESAGELTMRLADLGADLVRDALPRFVAGELRAKPQVSEGVTAAGKITTDEAHIDPTRHPAAAVLRAVRAFDPRPGAWTTLDGGRFKVWEAVPAAGEVEAGVAVADEDRVLLGCADGPIELIEVQPAGKPRMSAADWMRGRRGEPADLRG